MNFIDYCIATKNYSTLSAVNEYTKTFGVNGSLDDIMTNYIDSLDKKSELADQGKLKPRKDDYGYHENIMKAVEHGDKDHPLRAGWYGLKSGLSYWKRLKNIQKQRNK